MGVHIHVLASCCKNATQLEGRKQALAAAYLHQVVRSRVSEGEEKIGEVFSGVQADLLDFFST